MMIAASLKMSTYTTLRCELRLGQLRHIGPLCVPSRLSQEQSKHMEGLLTLVMVEPRWECTPTKLKRGSALI